MGTSATCLMFVGATVSVADECERAVPGVPLLRVGYAAGALARMRIRRPLVVVIDGTLGELDATLVAAGARDVGAEVVLAASCGGGLAAAVQSALRTAQHERARPPSYWSLRPGVIIDKLTLPDGPYPLSIESIDEQVPPDRPGAYVLLEVDVTTGDLLVARVGRSDSDLNRGIKRYLADPGYRRDQRYFLVTHYSFAHLETPESAFETECVLYHDWEPRLNEHHPGRPRGSQARCPFHQEDSCPPLDVES